MSKPEPMTLIERRQHLLSTIDRLKAQLFAAQGALSLVEELLAQEQSQDRPPDA